jgi:Xaa-Pro dipeptidase
LAGIAFFPQARLGSGMKAQVPLDELATRMDRFRAAMTSANPDWEIAAVVGKVNLYYFTGTMQDGLLLIPRQDEAVFWVRRSYERAVDESLFPRIQPMGSFRDAAAAFSSLPSTVYLETELVPLAFYQRLRKHFPFAHVRSADLALGAIRAVKSPFELRLMEQAGHIHRLVLEDRLPALLREGMSEAELGVELFSLLLAAGHHGVTRLGMFDSEILLGHVAFGDSSLYPTYFNGAGGNHGLSPAVPLLGSRQRQLRHGDLIYIDTGCGVEGYHTDKTMTYMFGRSVPDEARAAHRHCVEIQDEVASLLKPGAIPSRIYQTIMGKLEPGLQANFMGFGNRRVKFLGHGIGLVVDELPVIAEGFDEPLREGMALAIEPKVGIPQVGMVGLENTFVVTAEGGRSITGESRGLVPVGFDL